MAIIAILAGMLLPALNSALAKAKTIKCTGNLKQIGQGCMLYANDHKLYPTAMSTDEGYSYAQQYWHFRVMPYLGITKKPTNWEPSNTLRNGGPFECPAIGAPETNTEFQFSMNSFARGAFDQGDAGAPLLRPLRPSDRNMSLTFSGTWNEISQSFWHALPETVPTRRVTTLSKIIFVSEMGYVSDSSASRNGFFHGGTAEAIGLRSTCTGGGKGRFTPFQASYRHSGKKNALFLDLHAGDLIPEQINNWAYAKF